MTNSSRLKEPPSDPMRAKAAEFLGHDVMPLHNIDSPLCADMQAVIRWQHDQSFDAGKQLWHVLNRIREDKRLRDLIGPCTESYERLTAVYATLTDQHVDDVREKVCPGSAALHRSNKEAA